MHDIMGRDKWPTSVQQSIKVSHQIYSLNEESAAMFTLFGASKCIFFGIPMALAILGCGLALLGGDAVVAGSVLHVIVALWIFLSYLLWVYGILGFHLNSETLHTSRALLKYSSQHGCCGVYVRVLRAPPRPRGSGEREATRAGPYQTDNQINNQTGNQENNRPKKGWYRPSFRDERRSTTVHPMVEPWSDASSRPGVATSTGPIRPGIATSTGPTTSSIVHGVQRSNFITKAWT